MSIPLVQIAIDTPSIQVARTLAHNALAAGTDWIEIGKPLIEFEGLNGVRSLLTELDAPYVLLDVMIIAAPEKYIRAARELGAHNITVSALAPERTVLEAIEAGKRLDVHVTVDLFNTPETVRTARKYAEMGADYLMVHFGVDEKRHRPQGSPIDTLREVVASVDVPVAYATYDLAESRAAVAAGACIIVQGEPLVSDGTVEDLRHFITETKTMRAGA